MSAKSSDAEKPEKEARQFEETILNFLDQEIKVSSGVEANQDMPSDDVDALVNSLLQESITVSNEQAEVPETIAPSVESAAPARIAPPAQAMEQKPAQSAPVKKAVVPRAPAPQPADAGAGRAPVFSPPPQNRSLNWRVLVVAAAVICLAAGTGIVLYNGSRHNTPPKSANAAPAAATVTPPQAETPVPSTNPLDETPAAGTGQNAVSGIAASRATAAVVPPDPAPARPAAPREVKTSTQPPQPKGGMAAITPATSARTSSGDKATGSATVAAATNAPARAVEPITPQVVSTQMPSASTSAQFDTAITAGLPAAVSHDKLTLPARPTTRTVTPAEVINRVLPTYSELARRAHATGTVTIDVAVDAKGAVTDARAISGPPLLHQDAVKAVLQWKFRPATLDGSNVPSTSRVIVVFKQP